MKYEEFKENIVSELESFYGGDARIEVTLSKKNNGVTLEGLVIRIGETNISPIIYLQQYYEEFQKNGDIDDIIGKIVAIRERHGLQNAEDVVDNITDWNYVKDRIFPMILSAEKNSERMSELVTRPFLDLAVILYVRIDNLPLVDGLATVKLTRYMLESLGVSEDEAFAKALYNMQAKDGYVIQDVFSAIMDMMDEDDLFDESNERMFVLTNADKHLGASGLLLLEGENKLKVPIDTNYYVLPSSIHEVLLIPDTSDMDVMMLKQMVQEVNASSVAVEERLSDSVYYFNRNIMEVRKVA